MPSGSGLLGQAGVLETPSQYRGRRASSPEYDGLTSLETQRKTFGAIGSGETTLYTVRTGWRARSGNGLLLVHNPTSGAITLDVHHVPSGGSRGSTNLLYSASVAVDARATAIPKDTWHVLAAGDKLIVNTSAAGLNGWLTYLEERSEIAAYIGGFAANLGTGNTSILSVPALRVAVLASVVAYNPSGGALTLTLNARAAGEAVADGNELLVQSINTVSQLAENLALLASHVQDGIFSGRGSGAGLNVWLNAVLY